MKIETVCEGCIFESSCDGRFMKDAECWRRIKPLGIIKDCACLDNDARRCFELRYPKRTMDEYESTEVCDCTCHDKGMDFDGDDCDCQDCNDRRIV